MMDLEDLEWIRLLITDPSGPDALLTNNQIQAAFDRCDGDAQRAAAALLRVIATSEVLLAKKIRTQDLQTDGPAVAAALMAVADRYDQEADKADDELAGGFHVVEYNPTPRAAAVPELTDWPT